MGRGPRRREAEGRKQEVMTQPHQQLGASLSPLSIALISGETPTGRLGVPKPAGNFLADRRELPESPQPPQWPYVPLTGRRHLDCSGWRQRDGFDPVSWDVYSANEICHKFTLFIIYFILKNQSFIKNITNRYTSTGWKRCEISRWSL